MSGDTSEMAMDTGTDAPAMMGMEGGPKEASVTPSDAGDAGDAGSPPDGAMGDGAVHCSINLPTATDFNATLTNTVCQSLKTCCGTGAKFDMAGCLSTYSGSPGWMNSGNVIPFQDGGRVAYDPAAACQCLEGNASIACGLIPQATWNSIQTSCVGAIHGAVPTLPPATDAGVDAAASACASSFECAPGGYCTVQNSSDPGPSPLGTCLPLVPDGGACAASDFDCSYLALGTPPLYCDPGSNKCIPRLDAGASCQTNAYCALNNCSGFTCQSGIVFSDPVGSGGICDFFTLPDGG